MVVGVGFAIGFGVAACGSCRPQASPTTPAGLVGELVDAGCLAPGDDAAAAELLQTLESDAAQPWLVCLADGGSVVGCGVPCK